jgi:hypothetical protein
MKINSYKSHSPSELNPSHKNYTEKQLLPSYEDKVEISSSGKEKEWTLLFYNAGEGGERKMCTASLVDLEKVGSDENTNVVVMNYRSDGMYEKVTGRNREFKGTKTYYVTKHEEGKDKIGLLKKILPREAEDLAGFIMASPHDIKSPVIEEHPSDVNMGDKETLRKFLRENMEKYPAKHYAVFLSGHGSAFGGTMITHNPLYELNDKTIENLKDKLPREKLESLKSLKNISFSDNKLTEELKKLNFTEEEISMVKGHKWFELSYEGIKNLQSRMDVEKFNRVKSLQNRKFSETELAETLKNLNFSEEESKIITEAMKNALKKPSPRIKNEELGEVLEDVAKETGQKIDLLDMNTCFSANIESIYPLKDSVDSVVASENVVFSATQPFSNILSDLQKGLKEGLNISGRDLAKLIVEETRRQPLGNLYMETLSAIDMEKIGLLVDKIKNLQTLLMSEGIRPEDIKKAFQKSQKLDFSSVPKQVYLTDIGSFADEIFKSIDSQKVKEGARELKEALKESVFAEEHAEKAMESITSRVLRLLIKEKDLTGLSGLTVYYDDDANHPDSRLDQIQKTEYGKEVNTEKFLQYLSKATEKEKSEASFFRKTVDKIKEKHIKFKQKIAGKTGIAVSYLNILERIGKMAGMILGVNLMGKAGIPVYPMGFGAYFSVLGTTGAVKGIKETIKLAKKENLAGTEKEEMVEQAGKAGMGMAFTAYSLYLLGILPAAVMWPAAIASVSIRFGKELVKILVNKKDHDAFLKEAEQFSSMNTKEKLEYIGKVNRQEG